MHETDGEMFPRESTAASLEQWTGIKAVDRNLEQTKASTDTEVKRIHKAKICLCQRFA